MCINFSNELLYTVIPVKIHRMCMEEDHPETQHPLRIDSVFFLLYIASVSNNL